MALKLRAKVQFPTSVSGVGGIKVVKSNGVWVISPDFASLSSLGASAVTDPTLKQVWVYDANADQYNLLTLADLGDALYKLTSTTSNTIGTGSKTFTVETGRDIAVGSFVLITDNAAPTANYMIGQVTAYSLGSLTVSVSYFQGSGTKTAWTIRLASAPGTSKAAGYNYAWATDTTATDPGAGTIKANNATFASITSLYISETDADTNALASEIATWATGTSTVKGRLKIYDSLTPTNFMTFDVTALSDNGTWDTLTVTPIASGGSFSASESLRVQFTPKGDKGDTGPSVGPDIAPPQGRLTLTTGVAITAADVSGASVVYWTPLGGDYAPIWNGSAWQATTFSEVSITLDNNAAHTNYHQSGKVYDFFLINDNGTVRVGTGPKWADGAVPGSNTARGTGAGSTDLQWLNGIPVNKNSITIRFGNASGNTVSVAANCATYLGTGYMVADGQVDDAAGSRCLWNMWNAADRYMSWRLTGASHNYSTTSFQQANADATAKIKNVRGMDIHPIHLRRMATVSNSTSTPRTVVVGIGIDSTSNSSGMWSAASCTNTMNACPQASYDGMPGLGYHEYIPLEKGGGTDTQTWFDYNTTDAGNFNSGMRGSVLQ